MPGIVFRWRFVGDDSLFLFPSSTSSYFHEYSSELKGTSNYLIYESR